MAVVTVDEAALRLGVSVATVRRRLGAGSLAGTKVGRDWHVDVSALPAPGATSRKTRPATFTDDELAIAARYVSGFDLTDLWVPDVLRWADHLADQPVLIAAAKARVASGMPGTATEIRIPKSETASRAGVLIDLIDRIVYQAAVNRVAARVDAATSNRVFSSRLTSDPRFFFHRYGNQWKRWRDGYMAALKASSGLVVTTDLSSYFELIDQPTLLKELEDLTGDSFAIEVLRKQFRAWGQLMHRGVPQGPNASRLLGNAYLLPVDEFMIESGYDYYRYMDDVAIVVADRAGAARATADFERACHRRGLVVSASKTKVLDYATAEAGAQSALKDAAIYFMSTGSRRAIAPLRKLFDRAVPKTGPIDIGETKFALWRLARLFHRPPLFRLLARIEHLGPVASVSAAYLVGYLALPRTVKAIGEFLNDPDRNTSAYFESWLFATILEHPGTPPDQWLSRARVVAYDKNAANYHRVLAMSALALSGKVTDIAAVRRVVASEHDPDVVRGALVALGRVSKIDTPTEAAIVARHPALVPTLTYLKGRRDLPSLVYRGRSVPVRR